LAKGELGIEPATFQLFFLNCYFPPSPSQLREEVRQARSLASDRSDLQARLDEAGRRACQLEREAGERASQATDRHREEARGALRGLEQRLAGALRDAQQSQAELAALEATLGLLHLREVGRDEPRSQWFTLDGILHLLFSSVIPTVMPRISRTRVKCYLILH